MQTIKDGDFDINFVFDTLVNAEKDVATLAYQEGVEKGKREGELDGYHLGFHRGAHVGSEIGYYIGFSGYYKTQYVHILDDKRKAVLTKLNTLAKSISCTNDEDIDIFAQLADCRALYKKACIHLKTSPRLPNPEIN